MNQIRRRRWRIIRRVTIVATVGSVIFGLAVSHGEMSGALRGGVTGLFLTILFAGFSILYAEAPRGARFRQLPFLPALALRTLIYFLLIMTGLVAGALLVATDGSRGLAIDISLLWSTIFSFACVLLFNFVLQVNSILGQGELLKFVVGRYHRPRPEERIFLFLDLVGSTALAEQLGGVRFFDLLNEIYRDISEPILEHRGEIHKYVGDEVIVTWSLDAGIPEARCLTCAFAIQARLAGLAVRYKAAFRVRPAFRYGLHLGSVMSGELGSVKREIAYVGDPVNTAARLVDVCRQSGHDYVCSAAVLDRVQLPPSLRAETLGPTRLRGREATLTLYALHQAADSRVPETVRS